MRYLFFDLNLENILVANRTKHPRIIILFPVTRSSIKSSQNWQKVIEIANKSRAMALVVIDKTTDHSAGDFFSSNFSSEEIDLYIIRRAPREAIYDSQGPITLEANLWILQLHDDDTWGGLLSLPSEPNELSIYSPYFSITGKANLEKLSWNSSPPARINFTLIPSQVWNRFTEFLRFQGGHAAGSVDATLNSMVRLICSQNNLETFSYIYDDRHWGSRRRSRQHLKELALEDGWRELASPEMAVLNRALDGIAALYFFSDLIPKEKFRLAHTEMLHQFQLTPRKRLMVLLRLTPLRVVLRIFNLNWAQGNLKIKNKLQLWIAKRILIDEISLKSARIRDVRQVEELIDTLSESGDKPFLKHRFAAWKKILQDARENSE